MGRKRVVSEAESIESEPPSVSEAAKRARERMEAISKAAGKVAGVGPARLLIREVEAVPTIFPWLDYRFGVEGHPSGRLTTVQGPSNEGKSTYVLGLLRSFLAAGHFAHFEDHERSTPRTYAREMLSPELYDLDAFTYPERFGTYEDTRDRIRRWAENIADSRESGDLPDDVTGICVVDSLANLIPKKALEELSKELKAEAPVEKKPGRLKRKAPKDHVDGMGGRLGQIVAGFNTAWLKELKSLLADTRTAMVLIVREGEKVHGEGFNQFTSWEPVGGREVKFGPDLRLRVTARPIYEGDGKERAYVGERHEVEIYKTKLAGKEEKIPSGFFHTSNGTSSPAGFDRCYDVFDLARELGAIETAGSWLSFAGERLGQGEANAIGRLRADAALMDRVERECRARFKRKVP